jgi:hypothetical protein
MRRVAVSAAQARYFRFVRSGLRPDSAYASMTECAAALCGVQAQLPIANHMALWNRVSASASASETKSNAKAKAKSKGKAGKGDSKDSAGSGSGSGESKGDSKQLALIEGSGSGSRPTLAQVEEALFDVSLRPACARSLPLRCAHVHA